MTNDFVIETIGLHKVYKTGKLEVHALRGIDFKVKRGDFVGVVGRSGCGKSTLLNMLGCLDKPTKGVVVIDGIDITNLSGRKAAEVRRQKVGFVFQHYNLIPTLTALENVILPLRYARVGMGKRKQMARKALEVVGLDDREDHRPSELSGGEQQRACIARALVNDASIILADEPTGELDSQTAVQVVRVMKELNRKQGQTFIVVTHDPLIANETDRIIRLQDGMIESDSDSKSDAIELPEMKQSI